jgi:hypothetical protein
MTKSARLFFCSLCRAQVVVCSDCDRGQIYCGSSCARSGRVTSLRLANRRYQQTRQGRINHARRQQRYRQRQQALSKKVTYQGSKKRHHHDLLSSQPRQAKKPRLVLEKNEIYCHFCHQPVCLYLRNDFLRYFAPKYQLKKLFNQKK